MTRSELFCLMTSRLRDHRGRVLAVYTGVLRIPAGHLLTASVMSAPAALMIAKIIRPETDVSETAAGAHRDPGRTTVNGMDAICTGTADGLKLSLNVAAILIAFTALVALANALLSVVAGRFGWNTVQPLQDVLGCPECPRLPC